MTKVSRRVGLGEIIKEFPGLTVTSIFPMVLTGDFELMDGNAVFDSYHVKITVGSFPDEEPIIIELDGRVKNGDHRNPDGSCCTCVFEVWRAENADASLIEFLRGPVRHFFVGHQRFERTKVWPFGELAHGEQGIVESAARLLDIAPDRSKVVGILRFLARLPGTRYRRCPCGSGARTRTCHGDQLRKLHERISAQNAKAILTRLLSY